MGCPLMPHPYPDLPDTPGPPPLADESGRIADEKIHFNEIDMSFPEWTVDGDADDDYCQIFN
jgi:hypothetical protein